MNNTARKESALRINYRETEKVAVNIKLVEFAENSILIVLNQPKLTYPSSKLTSIGDRG